MKRLENHVALVTGGGHGGMAGFRRCRFCDRTGGQCERRAGHALIDGIRPRPRRYGWAIGAN